MSEIENKKKDMEQQKNAANMALSVEDYLTAYDALMIAGDLANEISNLLVDKKESDEYAHYSEDFYKQAKDQLNHLHLTNEDITKLRKRKLPKGFDKFIGEDKIKDYLTETVIKPWREHNLKSRPLSGIMIYGPEGVSKRVFVQSFIHELNATGYSIQPIANFSPYSENTKANMKRLFKMAEEKDNVVFYFTRPGAFFPKGEDDESKATAKIFLKLVKKELKRARRKNLNILFVASTAIPDKITPAAFGKGMFDDLLRVHHPDRATRKAMMEERLKGVVFEDPGTIDKLTPMTHGYVSKEVSRLCRRIKKTASLYGKDGKDAIITPDMMKRIMSDLGPMDDIEFKKNVDGFEKSLPESVHLVDDIHD